MPASPHAAPRFVLYAAAGQLLTLSDVSSPAELAHRRFADHFWATGTWPKLGTTAILRLSRVTAPRLKLLLTELKTLGWTQRAGQLKNQAIADTLQRAVDFKKARVAAGQAGAATRWTGGKAPPAATDSPPSTDTLLVLPVAAPPNSPPSTGTLLVSPCFQPHPAPPHSPPSTDTLLVPPPPATPTVAPPLALPVTVPTDSLAIAQLQLSDSSAHSSSLASKVNSKVNCKVRKECTKGSTLLSEQGTPLTLLNSEPLTVNPLTSPLTVSRRKGEAGSEKDFLADVREQFTSYSPERAESELTNFGGWWRNRFRENPDRARRVLAEIGSMCRERRIHSSPGAAAADLWSRLP